MQRTRRSKRLRTSADSLLPLRRFLTTFTTLAQRSADCEATLLASGSHLLKALVQDCTWLPNEYADPGTSPYASYLLYADPQERFVVTSFVWNLEAETPIHDHATWGMVGVLRGREVSQRFTLCNGSLEPDRLDTLEPGAVDAFSPSSGDIHAVRNGACEVTVSVHVYGADLVKWPHSTYCLGSNEPRPLFSKPHRNTQALIAG